ncbi:GTPase IMAP family member 8-like protein [Labeo rohita]|uniref:GTPase IMAP family member 8-like protein n=1 Tax=Labeo rohita TaxID=84645 RepID=A0A498NQ85_LABRO|nr:GTPase IMAP family member 8-like protein [Labeo rohita]
MEQANVRRLEEIRVVLLGWVLCGKSSAGNTILNRDEFDTGGRTGVGLWGSGDVDGRKMTVLDTPGWWKYIESELNPDFIRSAILESALESNVRRLEEIRVVLLGWVLCGKSSAGNTILNRDEFDTGGRTGVGLWGSGDVDGRKMTVLDTPGWWKYIESELNPDFIRSAILESALEYQDKPPDDPLNVIGTLQQVNIPEPVKTLLEREFRRWESIIIDGVRDSLQDIKSSFELSQAEKRQIKTETHGRAMEQELRAVLIGRRHSGKTSVTNTILETSETETEGSTDEHVKREGFVDGRKVSFVKTPGWWKTFNLKDLSIISKQQLLRRISLILPGPHAVLIVIRADSPFTDTDSSFLEEYVELLCPNVWTHTLIIFTRGDLLKQEDIE